MHHYLLFHHVNYARYLELSIMLNQQNLDELATLLFDYRLVERIFF
jgi:hypothetical protein